MIEKLGCFTGEVSPADLRIAEKINELVDAINTIQKEREAERFEIQEKI